MWVFRRWWTYPLIFLVALLAVFTLFSRSADTVETSPNQFVEQARAGRLRLVEISDDDRKLEYKLKGDNTTYQTEKDKRLSVTGILADAGLSDDAIGNIDIRTEHITLFGRLVGITLALAPLLLIVAVSAFLLSRVFGSRRQAASVDPVCRAKISRKRAVGTSVFQGVTYPFCSPEHKQAFDGDPINYLLQK